MTTAMRANPVRDKLLAGGVAHGVMAFEFFTPGLAPTLAAAGAEFVLLDMEHSGVGIETIKAQIAFAHGAGLVPLVRVPGHAYHLIAPVLDAGALGIMAP
ncbi:MAG: aldolase/citrate lyase family protein, partial [Betaproteobacteria bacterium]